MPREIKTTIAVDGEAAFKRAINEANTSLRNLGTQLTLAQANFKKDGDAMKLMETRSKALKGEIEQQEKIVRALEGAVTDSTKAFGENSEKTEKWEAELNRAKAKLANLQSELTLNDAGLDRNGKSFDDSSQKAADYQATLQTIGKNVSFQSVTEGIGSITSKIEAGIKKVFSFGKAIRETFADAGKWADNLNTDAVRYDMDVETLQRWQNAADLIDTPVGTIIDAMDKLAKKKDGEWKNSEGIDLWGILGIDKNADLNDVFWNLGEKLVWINDLEKENRTGLDANVLSMEVFGKSWRDLLPLFRAGREEWEKTVAEQDVVSEQQVKALGELDDANQALENSWDVTKYSFLASLAPTVTEVTEAVTEMLKAFNEWMDTDEGKQAMQELSEAMASLFEGLKDVSFADAIDAVSTAINGVKEALIWLDEHKNNIYDALKVIAAGFALLKVTELAANIGRIVSGLQGLGPVPGGKGTNTDTRTGGGADTTGTGGGVGALVGLKNSLKGKALDLSGWANAFNLTNATFFSDWFLHGTEAGRAINPEYGGSFSLENLWNGFWEGVNERIEEETRKREAWESGETWSFLDPESKKRHEQKEEREAFEAAAREYHAEHSESAMTPAEWESMSRTEREMYLRLHPMPNQEEMNREYLNGTTYWNAAPGGVGESAEARAEQTAYEVLQSIGGELNEAQKTAAEAWWDEFRQDPDGDGGSEKWNTLEQAFSGNQELLEQLRTAIDNWFTDNEDQGYLNQEDLLSGAVAEMRMNTESGKSIAEKIAGADFKKFNSLPGEIQTAAQRGTASGVSGIQVRLDGAAVGRLVAPYVSSYIASHSV